MNTTGPTPHSRQKERGATLLSVLLIITLMSAAALAATDALARSISVSRLSSSRADAFWGIRGAVTVAGVMLDELAGAQAALTADSSIFHEPTVFTSSRGTITVQLYEATNCFNLNALKLGGVDDSGGLPPGQLSRLLEGAGLFSSDARHLVDALADWMDADASPRAAGAEDAVYRGRDIPHRTPGQRLVSLSDVRAVEGFTPDVLARIAGLVCVRAPSDHAPLNLNTLSVDQAPLLAARFSSQLSVGEAERLILARPDGGWLNVDEFLLSRDVARIAPELRNESAISVRSTHIGAMIRASSQSGTLTIDAVFSRGPDGQFALMSSHRRPD
ncbi:MAG: type II secretion system minor pseudopilin GspK [Hyphomonas sp.]|nr:type II secretion system minor pseudopilin GspK [Hyphomonas sp.]